MRAAPCVACAGAPPSSELSGNRPSCRCKQLYYSRLNNLKDACGSDPGLRCFTRFDRSNRREFGVNELLHDICIVRVAGVSSAVQGKRLFYIDRVLWQVESEFARNSRSALVDFNKLVLGSAESKLFVGPQLKSRDAYLQVLEKPARQTTGETFVALIPHPSEWGNEGDNEISIWRFGDSGWRALDALG